ncbi:MAG TPA: hypothetical protein VGV64_07855 [Thermoplasmata archaeon]|nr:hypothetical protein [Thermoplasmata archaeon]
MVNRVVAHMDSPATLVEWTRETLARGVRHLVLVGGSSRYIPYPGPTVLEANRLVEPLLRSAGGLLGNIAIPQRQGEAHRLLAKTRAGASFFTTQILFDPAAALGMVREYDLLCRQAGVPPSAVILSLAPVIDEGDAEFVRWLGADIPEESERAILLGEEGPDASRRSIQHSLKLWEEVRLALKEGENEVPVGINVEEIMPRHLEPALDLLEAIADVIDRP